MEGHDIVSGSCYSRSSYLGGKWIADDCAEFFQSEGFLCSMPGKSKVEKRFLFVNFFLFLKHWIKFSQTGIKYCSNFARNMLFKLFASFPKIFWTVHTALRTQIFQLFRKLVLHVQLLQQFTTIEEW